MLRREGPLLCDSKADPGAEAEGSVRLRLGDDGLRSQVPAGPRRFESVCTQQRGGRKGNGVEAVVSGARVPQRGLGTPTDRGRPGARGGRRALGRRRRCWPGTAPEHR